jgi:hypothetical protein
MSQLSLIRSCMKVNGLRIPIDELYLIASIVSSPCDAHNKLDVLRSKARNNTTLSAWRSLLFKVRLLYQTEVSPVFTFLSEAIFQPAPTWSPPNTTSDVLHDIVYAWYELLYLPTVSSNPKEEIIDLYTAIEIAVALLMSKSTEMRFMCSNNKVVYSIQCWLSVVLRHHNSHLIAKLRVISAQLRHVCTEGGGPRSQTTTCETTSLETHVENKETPNPVHVTTMAHLLLHHRQFASFLALQKHCRLHSAKELWAFFSIASHSSQENTNRDASQVQKSSILQLQFNPITTTPFVSSRNVMFLKPGDKVHVSVSSLAAVTAHFAYSATKSDPVAPIAIEETYSCLSHLSSHPLKTQPGYETLPLPSFKYEETTENICIPTFVHAFRDTYNNAIHARPDTFTRAGCMDVLATLAPSVTNIESCICKHECMFRGFLCQPHLPTPMQNESPPHALNAVACDKNNLKEVTTLYQTSTSDRNLPA